jgi:hypothetical protein
MCNSVKTLASVLILGMFATASTAWAQEVRSVRALGGPTRFTAPVRDIPALRTSMSRPNIQRDIATVLERAGMAGLTAEIQGNLAQGRVTEATLAPGTTIEWMALRRGGPNVVRNIRWDGAAPLEGFEFIVDDLNETYTFFVPEICGNLSLVRREPSREAARRAEAAKAQAAAAAAKAAADKAAADKAAADKAAADKAAADKAAAAKAAAAKAAADKAAADAAAAKAAADKAAADKAAAEAAALAADLRVRPFFGVYVGKQQRQYDETDPAGLGLPTSPTRPDVPAFGDALVGFKGGVSLRLTDHFSFAPAIGIAANLEEGDRTTLFGDAELDYIFRNGAYLGTGLTLWDPTHNEIFTLGWLGTAGVPIWRNDTRYHQLLFSVEYRQLFDRLSDPDVNYQFWGGLKYLFK